MGELNKYEILPMHTYNRPSVDIAKIGKLNRVGSSAHFLRSATGLKDLRSNISIIPQDVSLFSP